MGSPADAVKDILVTAGIGAFGGTADWAIFISSAPDKPDPLIAIFDTGGATPNPKWLVDYPTVQVQVRGAQGGYQALYAKAKAVKDALLGYPSTDFNSLGYRLVSVTMNGDIASLGNDETYRTTLVLNFQLITEPLAGTNRESL